MAIDIDAVVGATFGHRAATGLQDGVARRVAAGRDVFAAAPPGSGASTALHLAALACPGTAVVVSPVRHSLRDNVASLGLDGVAAAALAPWMREADMDAARQAYQRGRVKVLHVHPDLLASDDLVRFLRKGPACLFAVDDAHRLSTWSPGFDRAHLSLGDAAAAFAGMPRVVMAATADARTHSDLVERLGMDAADGLREPFDRPNVRISVVPRENPRQQVLAMVRAHAPSACVVHCGDALSAKAQAAHLVAAGVRALPCHAGMEGPESVRDAFRSGRADVLCVDRDWGRGIDRPDVALVVHLAMPAGIEAHYQDFSGAGRDGRPAEAVLLYGLADVASGRQSIADSSANEANRRNLRTRFDALVAICEDTGCRRVPMLAAMGEGGAPPCGNCDACLGSPRLSDARVDGQKAMSAVRRTGGGHGAGHLVAVLRGTQTDRVVRAEHDGLKTFGVGSDRDEAYWLAVLRRLIVEGALDVDSASYGGIVEGPHANAFMRGERPFGMPPTRPSALAPVTRRRMDEADAAVAADLGEARDAAAAGLGVPAHVLADANMLAAVARRRPACPDDVASMPGVGRARARVLAEAFLPVVAAHARPTRRQP